MKESQHVFVTAHHNTHGFCKNDLQNTEIVFCNNALETSVNQFQESLTLKKKKGHISHGSPDESSNVFAPHERIQVFLYVKTST